MNGDEVKVLLVGAGALGVFFTSKLAAAGAQTAVVARSDYETASIHGYEINDKGTVCRFQPDFVIRSAAQCPFTPDYLLITSKILPEVDLKKLTAGVPVSPSTVIVLIQNGIAIEEPVAEIFPRQEILSTVAYLCASRPGPGKIVNTGPGRLETGSYPAGPPSPAAKHLAELFIRGGAPCQVLENIQYARWRKLLWNVPFNPVSVLAGGADTGWLCDGAEREKLCRDLMDEVIAIAASVGIMLAPREADEMIAYTKSLKPYNSSMLQDYLAGRPLEVEAILGNALRIAGRNGISAPRMETCYALLKSIDQLRRRIKSEKIPAVSP